MDYEIRGVKKEGLELDQEGGEGGIKIQGGERVGTGLKVILVFLFNFVGVSHPFTSSSFHFIPFSS